MQLKIGEEELPKFAVFITEEYEKKFKKLPKNDKLIIERKLKQYIIPQLQAEPRFGLNVKKLRGYDPDTWRYRIGKYRVFYIINEETNEVDILTISQRKDAY